MKYNYRVIVIIFIIVMLFLWACSNKSPNDSQDEIKTQISDDAIIVSNENWQNYFISESQDGMVLTFSVDMEDIYTFNENDILISGNGIGFLGRILKKEVKEDQIIITTVEASLAEVIKHGTVSFQFDLSDLEQNESLIDRGGDKPFRIDKQSKKLIIEPIYFILFSQGGERATLSGEIELSMDVDGELDFNFGIDVLRFEYMIEQELNINFTSTMASYEDHKEFLIAGPYPLGTYSVVVLGLPVTITPVLELYAGANADLSSTVESEIYEGLKYTAGLEYKNSNWNKISDLEDTLGYQPPELTAEAELKVYIKPKLKFKFYQSVAPYIDANLFAKLDADISETPWWSLYAGYTVGVGVNMGILDWLVSDYYENFPGLSDSIMIAQASPISGPLLSVSPSLLDHGTGPPNSSTMEVIHIENIGTDTLEWTITDDRDWLSVSKTSGKTINETHLASYVNRSGLGGGNYTGTITVTSNGGTGTITVSMGVESTEPVLTVHLLSYDFGNSETVKTFWVINSGEGTLNWTASANRNWMTVSPTGGTAVPSKADYFNVIVDRSGLSEGSYTGTVTVNSDGGNQDVNISMEVGDFEGFDIEWVTINSHLTFTMGDVWGDGESDEMPTHTVTLNPYQIGKYEVTNDQYAYFLNEALDQGVIIYDGNNVFASDGFTMYLEMSSSYCSIDYKGDQFQVESGKENHPIGDVTWFGAKAMADFYNWRLPTEAEWERAAKGPDPGRKWPWGDTQPTCDYLNYNYDCTGETMPVGSYDLGKSAEGCYDLAGNVREWCADWYGSYSSGQQTDPQGPTEGTSRVIRGGTWNDGSWRCRTVERGYHDPYHSIDDKGFRLARDLEF